MIRSSRAADLLAPALVDGLPAGARRSERLTIALYPADAALLRAIADVWHVSAGAAAVALLTGACRRVIGRRRALDPVAIALRALVEAGELDAASMRLLLRELQGVKVRPRSLRG